MYRSEAASCPACGCGLTPLQSSVLPVSGCANCGGVWLGPDAAVHVMRGLGDDLERGIAASSADAARISLVPAVDSGVRACPTCGLVMARLAVAKITIDSCATHGSWFDRHEVEEVVAACQRLRARQSQPPGVLNSAANLVGDTANGALELIGMSFSVVSGVLESWSKVYRGTPR